MGVLLALAHAPGLAAQSAPEPSSAETAELRWAPIELVGGQGARAQTRTSWGDGRMSVRVLVQPLTWQVRRERTGYVSLLRGLSLDFLEGCGQPSRFFVHVPLGAMREVAVGRRPALVWDTTVALTRAQYRRFRCLSVLWH